MSLMSEHFGSLSIIPKEVMQTCLKRGVLIEQLEPDGSDKGTQESASNDNDIKSVEVRAEMEPFTVEDQQQDGGFTIFKFSQLAASTNNFSYQNKIGEGSFGPVYKGVLANGVHVAIKKRRVFPERLKAGVFLSWPLRCRIIEGIAQGAAYLHHHSRLGSLVHGDLKPGNILLDCDMNPRISDFGLVEVLESEEDEKEIDAISGTPGYIDPLLVEIQRISTKSDVYGFGATSLVIMTAHDPLMEFDTGRSLVGHAWELWSSGRAMELIDEEQWS
ncbi:putative cysteine-rich receptor-like protein kinase 39 [Panicum virgatum]|uniref:putative cysteine-rich receptor-like protein kinase 39 n=1 Tax=Panicum virgatum TaxID=38727 RepID=UPI0019D524B6|nr:putative cysteine-rich receptor-like protein kinase 39 [Panicum virgatum]